MDARQLLRTLSCIFLKLEPTVSRRTNVGQPEATTRATTGQRKPSLTFNFARSTRTVGSLEPPFAIGCKRKGKKMRHDVTRTTVVCKTNVDQLLPVPDPRYNIHYFLISCRHTYVAQQPAESACFCPWCKLTATTLL